MSSIALICSILNDNCVGNASGVRRTVSVSLKSKDPFSELTFHEFYRTFNCNL